ncbi:MAG: hypothetical protein ABI986_13445 [Chloroflexota bacterium]
MAENISVSQISNHKKKIFQLLLLLVLLVIILVKLGADTSDWQDWKIYYRPATLALIHGESPYSVAGFPAPPWSLIPLIPFALLPEKLGNVLYFVFGIAITTFILLRLKAKPIVILIFLTSSPVIGYFTWGNIDWMPMLSLILPMPIALIAAVTKPQIGIGFVIYSFFVTLKTKGLKEVIKVFAPLTLLTLLSFWMFGFWVSNIVSLAQVKWQHNVSFWPNGLFIAFWLLYKSIQKESPSIGLASSPFISPYVTPFTWVAVLPALLEQPVELLIVSIGLWMPVFIKIVNQFFQSY